MSHGGSELSTFFGPDDYDYDEGPTRGRRRGRRRRRRRGPLGTVLAVCVIAGLVAGIVYGGRAVLDRFGNVPDYTGNGAGSVRVEVKPGDTASDIATTLAKAGVVRSERAFREAAKADPSSTSIQPGHYRLRKQMSAATALALLLDPKSRLLARVTVPEGRTATQILALLADKSGRPLPAFQAAAHDTARLGLPGYARGRLEGFLFPATYDFDPDTTPVEMLRQMVSTFREKAEAASLSSGAKAVGLTPYQVVVVASMVEREARVAEDQGKIARVIYNRLDQDYYLGVDAVVMYGLGRTRGRLSAADLAKATPYNVYRVKGLPPTPIASPGLAALRAALHPTRGDWLYYVLKDRSRHFFTADREEFNQAKARCQAAGLC